MKRMMLITLLLVAAGAAGWLWWLNHEETGDRELMLHGNMDLRQVQLSFNNSERIAAVLVQEGDRVRQGQVVARLDTSRLGPQAAQAEAQTAAQRQVVTRLRNGSRPEEIAQARANVESAKADSVNARQQYERVKSAMEASGGRAVRQQDVDNAVGTYTANKAVVDSDLANVQHYAALVSFEKVYAPFDGVVTARNTDIGDLINSGSSTAARTDLFHIAQTGTLRVYVNVPEEYSRGIVPGQHPRRCLL